MKSTVSGVFEDLSETETANRAESGQLQFWFEPSEILNLRSSNTPHLSNIEISSKLQTPNALALL